MSISAMEAFFSSSAVLVQTLVLYAERVTRPMAIRYEQSKADRKMPGRAVTASIVVGLPV
jgi:hypothetical protein